MRTFTVKDRTGKTIELEADSVTFEPHHVVFRLLDGRVVQALHSDLVWAMAEQGVAPDPDAG